MKKYPDFWSVIIGSGQPGFFFGFTVVALVCSLLLLLIQASNRNMASSNTPVAFSWRFLFADNLLRILTNFLLVPVAIRLTYEYVPPTAMLFISVGIGFGSDGLCILAQRIGLLTTSRLANKVLNQIEDQQPSIIITNKKETNGKENRNTGGPG